jgi:hypothetical protein
MKTASNAGALSGCAVWLIAAAALSLCLIPAACLFALFTGTSELSAGLIGPLVCPPGATAVIERAPTTYVDDEGFTREAMGAEMVCADDAGQVVARPAPLPNWLWTGLVSAAALVLAGGLGLVFAAPVGVVVSRLKRN